ncbi:hypothetical protein DFA_01970 [Cavenderia fasciculata]|uniref:DUF1772 family protein n=1 Tax=Cavenderia fasciculata TaxID=261658 RepID=F4PR23_CACFS|nr:uncharacterized protein DFA_01970 [Cavenderia fasciculata]EGG22080.1 hypothetical protein DFA_01970 [Cavenderia fasciculata]|eukprot:XP_004359931.1 hypothetical protein DFA_01970 [Cavenderia fasciculata]
MKDHLIKSYLKLIAIGSIGLFSGIAISCNLIDIPILLNISKKDKQKAATSFKTLYTLAAPPQAIMSLLAATAGLVLFFRTRAKGRWALFTILSLLPVPFTLAYMGPLINKPLLEMADNYQPKIHDDKVESLILRWRQAHSVRILFSLMGFGVGLGTVTGLF